MADSDAPQHRWLARLVGDWTFEVESLAAPGEDAVRHTGTERARPLGDLWVVSEGAGRSPEGDENASIMTLGYDAARGRVVGSFVASMMSHLWLYDGTFDDAGRVLTLDTEGPSFTTEGAMGRYQDTITFDGDDERVMTSAYRGDDGAWHRFMTARYRRV